MCPHTAMYAYAFFYMCPHTTTYVSSYYISAICVPSYCHICVCILLHVSAYYYICVGILYICRQIRDYRLYRHRPHITTLILLLYVSFYYCMGPHTKMCPHTLMFVLILLCVSSYPMCVQHCVLGWRICMRPHIRAYV